MKKIDMHDVNRKIFHTDTCPFIKAFKEQFPSPIYMRLRTTLYIPLTEIISLNLANKIHGIY